MNKKLFTKLFALVLIVCVVFSLAIVVSSAAEATDSISFASEAQRVSQDSNSQVWKAGNVTFTNNKSASTNAVVGNTNPVRLYANSSLTFETASGNITKIVAVANSTSYATALVNSVGAEATANGSTVTITLATPAPSYTVAKLTAQVRLNSLAVTYMEAVEGCTHEDATETTVDAKPGVPGMITTKCNTCGTIVSEEEIPALDCNVNFVVPEGATAPEAITGLTATMPEAVEAPESFNAQEYTFAGWAAAAVEDSTAVPTLYAPGTEVKLTGHTTFYAVYTYSAYSMGGVYEKLTGAMVPGNYIVVSGDSAMVATVSSGRLGLKAVDIKDDAIATEDATIIWTISQNGDYWEMYNAGVGQYAASTGAKNKAQLLASSGDKTLWTISADYTVENVVNKAAGVNYTLRRNENYGFACYASSTGTGITFYKESAGEATYYTSTLASSNCDHANTSKEVINATCTSEGAIIVTCDACGATIAEKCEVLEMLEHKWDAGEITTNATCVSTGVKTYTCSVGGETKTETIPYLQHDYENGVCLDCHSVETPKAGVAYKFGMYQEQIKKTCYINGNMANTYYFATTTDAYASLTVYLEETAGGFYMYTYIGSQKNYINMVASGSYVNGKYQTTASTVYTYDATKNTMVAKVNEINYWFGVNSGKTFETMGPVNEGYVTRLYVFEPKFNTASVVLGTDLGMIYNAYVPDGVPTMEIEFNGMTYTIAGESNGNGTYNFVFNGIGPHQMAENIDAALIVDGEVVAEFNGYSVEKNLKNILANDASLESIVNAVLVYGNEAENYNNIEGGVDASNIEVADFEIDDTYNMLWFKNAEDFGFTAVGVNFDYTNKIFVKFYVEGDFEFYYDGVKVEMEKSEDGYYKFYTDALTAKQFNNEIEFVIKANGTEASLVYSVNSYAYKMQNDAEIGALVKALFAYSKAVVEYKA